MFDGTNGWVLVFFFNKTFRISYSHLVEKIRTVRNGLVTIRKNGILGAGPPNEGIGSLR